MGAQETQSFAVNDGTPTVTATSYTYDAAGNRLSMVQGADALYYHYNDYDQLVCTDTDNNMLLYTENGSGVILEQNILETDGSMVCSRRTDTNYYWYRKDIRGSVTNIVDEDDVTMKSYTYDNTSSMGTIVNSFAYTGLI